MSKEIDWNTVETVWDYADKVDQDIFVALFKDNKKDYIKHLRKGEHPNMKRLLDLAFLFDYVGIGGDGAFKRIKAELEKDKDYISEKNLDGVLLS